MSHKDYMSRRMQEEDKEVPVSFQVNRKDEGYTPSC